MSQDHCTGGQLYRAREELPRAGMCPGAVRPLFRVALLVHQGAAVPLFPL